MKKWLGLVAVMMALVLVLTACGSSGSIEGTWKLTGTSGNSSTDALGMAALSLLGATVTISFSGGRYTTVATVWGQSTTETGTYTVDGNTLTMDGETMTFTITGKVLTLKQGGQTLTFQRQ